LPEKYAKATVYSKLSKREIPGHKKSKKWFFLKSEIDNWLKESLVKTKADITQNAEDFLVNKKRRG